MPERRRWTLLSALFITLFGGGSEGLAAQLPHEARTAPTGGGPAVAASSPTLPLRFEPNRGQFDDRIRFLARGQGYGLYLTPEGATLSLQHSAPAGSEAAAQRKHAPRIEQGAVVSMRLVGGRTDVEPTGTDELPGVTNYFGGKDPSRWRTHVEGYGRVRYAQVLPGVDVVYYGTGQRQLEYDLVLARGVDPMNVALRFDGAESLEIEPGGSAVLHLRGGGEIVQPAPLAYQTSRDGAREVVAARYVLRDGRLAFALGAFDSSRDLVIDPTLVYSTYLGGSSTDYGQGIAIDSAGEAFVTGYTTSTNFPTTGRAYAGGTTYGDAFVTKFNAAGSALVYSTYLGGSGDDEGFGIAVDGLGQAYVTGNTTSTDFPTNSLRIQGFNRGNGDAFVTKLNGGGGIVYSTYLGGSLGDGGAGIAVDSDGEAFVIGYTFSTNFPTASPIQAALAGVCDAFVAKISPAGFLAYSTYLGGSSYDQGLALAIDGAGEAFVTGEADSTDFPTVSPIQAAYGGFADAFVTKLNAAGSAFVYSTYLGGASEDMGIGIAVDSAGEAFVTGRTDSTDFPTASPFQAINKGTQNAFVTKLNTAGSALVYSTYLGGNGDDEGYGIAVDSAGQAFVTGQANSADFPRVSPIQGARNGNWDAFITKLNVAGSALAYSTYLGGTSFDVGTGIAVDTAGNAFVLGVTQSTNFPTMNPFQASSAGGSFDTFIAKISTVAPVPAIGRYRLWLLVLLLLAGAALGHRRAVGEPR